MLHPSLRCTAFAGYDRIASGELRHVAMKAKQIHDAHPERVVRLFNDADGQAIELPLELPSADFLRLLAQPVPQALEAPPRRRPGRPKLGVVAREVTLLPRHWEWLAAQPGGASVALRRLVEAARKISSEDDTRRAAQETSYRFMSALMGDAVGFEEAARALFAGSIDRFEHSIQHWPEDVRDHVTLLATDAFLH